MRSIKILVLVALVLTSCTKRTKNCNLIGKWNSTEFISDKSVDLNKDGIYNKDLLKEDECTEVIFNFLGNGKAETYSKNRRTKCDFKKSTFSYYIEGNQIIADVNGMTQKYQFEISNCKLRIQAKERGLTEKGKQSILISSIFEKK